MFAADFLNSSRLKVSNVFLEKCFFKAISTNKCWRYSFSLIYLKRLLLCILCVVVCFIKSRCYSINIFIYNDVNNNKLVLKNLCEYLQY